MSKIRDAIRYTHKLPKKLELDDFEEQILELELFDDAVMQIRPNTGVKGPQGVKGYVNGVSYDSKWEYAYYLWRHDVKGEYIERNNKIEFVTYTDDSGKLRKFYPDFKVSSGFVEVKGFFRAADQQKMSQHPEIEFISAVEMKPIIKELYKRFPNWEHDYVKKY